MSFDLVRLGWPNMVAIAALAVMPILAMATAVVRQDGTAPTQQIDSEAPLPAASIVYIFD
jgi:hypothetical protein